MTTQTQIIGTFTNKICRELFSNKVIDTLEKYESCKSIVFKTLIQMIEETRG